MKRFALLSLLIVSCAEHVPTGEVCQTVEPAACVEAGCAASVTYRQITAEAPEIDDDCFGEPYAMCVDDPDAAPGDAHCVFIYRSGGDGMVLRAETTVLPAGWVPCDGTKGEPAGCACASVGACGR